MPARTRDLLRDDAGFSLMELLVALAIGSVVLTALMVVFLNGLSGTAKVTDRVDATARARTTTNIMTSLLQAGVCNNNTAPIIAADANSVTFTSSLGGPDADPVEYRLRWDSTTKNVYQDTFNGNGHATDGTVTYPTTPTSTVLIGSKMMPTDGATMFTYYPFSSATGMISGSFITGMPITAVNTLKSIVAVNTNLLALPSNTVGSSDPRSTSVESQSVVGQVDPSNPGQGTQC
jgi:prepilin-type N-terminal cleavage/methylation domain-containing protein